MTSGNLCLINLIMQMTKILKNKKILICTLFLLLLGGVGVAYRYEKEHEMLRVDLKTFQTTGGWGYDVRVDSKTFIHQEYIPAVEGQKRFASEADALKTGQLVVRKLTKGQLPTLSKEEIAVLGVDK
ncbi:MAG: hypothetical protein C5B52_13310 [Bacteroidetes bacterium]|nr:MAG: hypothetical protein C5B52_13310 [Bacteroidota bacterium]